MALDFPSPGTTGQLFAAAGVVWRFDGTKWVASAQLQGAVTISDTPPANPPVGSMWWDSAGGNLYVWYQDPDSAEWVIANSGGIPDAPNDGGVYARQSQAWTNTSAVAAAAPQNTGRNLLHNGNFWWQQRGAGPFTTAAAAYSFLERWYNQVDGTAGSVTTNFVAITDAQRAAIGDETATWATSHAVTGTATANSHIYLGQSVEGVRRTANKTITVSFWAWAASGTPKVGVTWSQWFGSGGSPSAGVNGTGVAVTISTTPVRYSVTFSIPSTAGKTLGTNGDDYMGVVLMMSSTDASGWPGPVGNQSGTFNFYGVQCEIGSTATPFDAGGTLQQQLANCQRFYQGASVGMYAYSAAGQALSVYVNYPAYMRAPPAITFTNTGYSNCSGINAAAIGAGSALIGVVTTGTAQAAFTSTYYCSADL